MALPPEKRPINFNEDALSYQERDQYLTFPLRWSEVYRSAHIVQFYLTDDHLLDSVSRFMRVGLERGATCISIATDVHLRGIEERLGATRFDLSSQRKFIGRDASMMLSLFLKDGMLDPQAFFQVVKQLTEQSLQEQIPVYIFGEMVQILWTRGNQEAAIQLEMLWNDVLANNPSFSLLCAYCMQSLAAGEHSALLEEICQQHSQVIPDEEYTSLTNPQASLQAIAQWQQQSRARSLEASARKVAEDHYFNAENRYHHLFEASMDGIVLVNPHSGTIVDVNPAFTELLRYKREDLLNQKLWEFDLFPDQEHIKDILQQVEMQQKIWYEMVRLRTREGHVHIVEVTGTLLQTNPFPIIQCHVHSVTDRVQMQTAIQEREKRFRLLANQAPFIIWQSDPCGGGSYFNPAWCTFTGLSEEQSMGTGWIQLIHPKDRRTAFTQWMQTFTARLPYHAQFRIHCANGCYCLVQIDGNPWTDLNGAFSGYIGTMKEHARSCHEV